MKFIGISSKNSVQNNEADLLSYEIEAIWSLNRSSELRSRCSEQQDTDALNYEAAVLNSGIEALVHETEVLNFEGGVPNTKKPRFKTT